MKALTKDNPESAPFAFEGIINLLICNGQGTVTLMRSVGGSDYYPLSLDLDGTPAVFTATGDGECAYNGTLEERGLEAMYKLSANVEAGEINYHISRVKNVF